MDSSQCLSKETSTSRNREVSLSHRKTQSARGVERCWYWWLGGFAAPTLSCPELCATVELATRVTCRSGTVVAPVSPRFFGPFSLNAPILLPQPSDWLELTEFWVRAWDFATVCMVKVAGVVQVSSTERPQRVRYRPFCRLPVGYRMSKPERRTSNLQSKREAKDSQN